MSFEVSKEFKDQLRIQELAKKWGLRLEQMLTGFPEEKIRFYIESTIAQFDSLEECEKWLMEEFEEK